MGAARYVGRVGGLAVALGLGAAVLTGAAAAWASPNSESSGPAAPHTASADSAPHSARPHRVDAPATRGTRSQSRTAAGSFASNSTTPSIVDVKLPAMPVTKGASFTVSPDFIKGFAARYVAAGGDPTDSPRFFFGDLAVDSLDALADPNVTRDQTRLLLGNLATSGYFGGIWLRDNLRDTSRSTAFSAATATASISAGPISPSAIGIHLFDALAAGLVGASQSSSGWVVRAAAHVSVPVLLALYGYNKGYLDVVLENPPAGVPSMQDTLSCTGFLACNSSAFPLELATRYDGALGSLGNPASPRWREMAAWTTVLQTATGAGRFVWEAIAAGGGFSPASYTALVDQSSAYLMVSKAAVLSSMIAYADGDTSVGRSSLRLQAGLWMWSGAYFAGLASGAPAGTLPQIVVS
jgi:hypothetical protein